MTRWIWPLAKVGVLIGILAYLIESGRLDAASASILLDSPRTTVILLFNVGFGMIGLNAVRWWVLMRAQHISVSFWRTFAITMVSFFFNSFLPGALSQDVVRGVYILRGRREGEQSAQLVFSVVLDRYLGAIGMVLALLAGLWGLPEIGDTLLPKYAIYGLSGFGLAGCMVLILLLSRWQRIDWLAEKASHLPKVGPFLLKTVVVLRAYKGQWGVLGVALGLSLATQIIFVWAVYWVLQVMQPNDLSFAVHLFCVPLAEMATIIPLTPAGAGVGHAVMEFAYQAFGLTVGAELFNVYFMVFISVSLLGGIPYLWLRQDRQKALIA